MRIEPSKAFNGAVILNDAYNANPTAVRAAIDLVAGLSGFRRRWIVLGDMLELGPEEAELHLRVGAYVQPASAEAVLTCGPLSTHTAEGAKASHATRVNPPQSTPAFTAFSGAADERACGAPHLPREIEAAVYA